MRGHIDEGGSVRYVGRGSVRYVGRERERTFMGGRKRQCRCYQYSNYEG